MYMKMRNGVKRRDIWNMDLVPQPPSLPIPPCMKQVATVGVMLWWERKEEWPQTEGKKGPSATPTNPSHDPAFSSLEMVEDSPAVFTCELSLSSPRLWGFLHAEGLCPGGGTGSLGTSHPEPSLPMSLHRKPEVSVRGSPVQSWWTLGVYQKPIVQRGAHKRTINKLEGIKVASGAGHFIESPH